MSSLFRCMRHVACRVAHTREHFRCEFPEKTGFHSFRLFRANLETAIGVFANASPFLVRHSSFFGGMKNEDRLDFRLADARHKRGVSQPFRLNNRVRKCKCFAREPHTRPGRMEIAGIFRWVFITFTNLPHCYGIERSHEIWQMVARGKQANDKRTTEIKWFAFLLVAAAFWFLTPRQNLCWRRTGLITFQKMFENLFPFRSIGSGAKHFDWASMDSHSMRKPCRQCPRIESSKWTSESRPNNKK